MNIAIHEDQMRVTSIPFRSSKLVIFSGVPLRANSYKASSGKYYVTIKAKPESLPVIPAIGQHWIIQGTRKIEDINLSDYVMAQHTYEHPVFSQCSLPQSGEQLIRFISKENEFKGIGESKARALWERLGLDLYTIMREDTPEARQKLRDVLSEDSIESLFIGFAKYKNLVVAH